MSYNLFITAIKLLFCSLCSWDNRTFFAVIPKCTYLIINHQMDCEYFASYVSLHGYRHQ